MIEALTPERAEFVAGIRKFLEQRSPLARIRAYAEGPGADGEGFDRAVWDQLARELGLPAIAIPEEHGGMGFGPVELGLAVTELGRQLYNGPFLSGICLAVPVLTAAAAPDEAAELLPTLADGSRTAALAYREPDGPWSGRAPRTRWREVDGRVSVSGEKALVVSGADVDLLVVTAAAADDPKRISVLVVDATADGVTRRRLPALDDTRPLAAVTFTDAAARLVGTPGAGDAALRSGLQVGAILLAADSLGCAEACLAMAVEYAKTREQFGRPIGSFQAVKHRCVDMLVDVEAARSAVLLALTAMAAGDDLAELASLALAQCSEAFTRVAEANIAVHGGIGFTWEHDAHLYLKRARASAVLLGSVTEHRELLAQVIGL